MTTHTWAIEEIDGGPVGVGDFWHCTTCGVSGGPANMFAGERLQRYLMKVEDTDEEGRWHPFIAGPAHKVSWDCETAQAEIKAYLLNEHIPGMPKWCRPQCELIAEAVRTTKQTNLLPIVELLYQLDRNDPSRRKLKQVRWRLIDLGFLSPLTTNRCDGAEVARHLENRDPQEKPETKSE